MSFHYLYIYITPDIYYTFVFILYRDLGTGTSLCSFKGNCSPPRAACPLGRDYFVSCQLKKPLLHFWDWRKEQITQKSFITEKCWSIACSQDGSLCAAGGDSGSIHLWDTSVGRLLLSWQAHHRKVTSIAFSDQGTEIVAGSEDSLVTVWSVSQVMQCVLQPHEMSLKPRHTWSDHTMPISDIVIGAGVSDPYVYCCSLDHRVSVRSLVSGRLLTIIKLPSALTALALDPLEYCAYVGSIQGTTYKVSFIEAESNSDLQERHKIEEFKTISGQVTSIAVSKTGENIVIGTEDGSVLLWDTITCQQIRKSSIGSPVSTVLVLGYPLGMAGRGRGRMPESMFRLKPLGPFSKTIGSSGISTLQPWQTSLVLIDSRPDIGASESDDEADLDEYLGFKHEGMMDRAGPALGETYEALQERISQLVQENALLAQQKERAMALLKKPTNE